jgi:hypothetical protein
MKLIGRHMGRLGFNMIMNLDEVGVNITNLMVSNV